MNSTVNIMKQLKTGLLIFIVFMLSASFTTNDTGDPGLRSTLIETIKIKKYLLTFNYFTIENNFATETSSDTANMEAYMTFARNAPSYQFVLTKQSDTLCTITYLQKNEGEKSNFHYEITDFKDKQRTLIQSRVWGEITEKRVDEMIFKKYDPSARKGALVGTNPRQFQFNGIIYGYQDYEKVKEEITELVKKKY